MKRNNNNNNNNNNNDTSNITRRDDTLPPILRVDVKARRKRDRMKLRNAAYRRGLYTGRYLRNVVTNTKYASEVLLDKFRLRAPMTELERQAVWALLWQLVNTRSLRHYGQFQYVCPKEIKEWYSVPAHHIKNSDNPVVRGYDRHIERIMLLLEWLTINIDRSVGWCIVSWKLRFAAFEEIRYWRYRLGIGVDLREAINSAEIRWSIFFRRVLRERGIDETDPRAYDVVYQYWASQRRPPRRRFVNLFNKRWAHHIALLEKVGFNVSKQHQHVQDDDDDDTHSDILST